MSERPERLDLLDVLDGLVNRDGATTGLSGEICVGLKKPDGFRWWRACFRPRFYTQFVDAPSASAHATLFIDHDTAESVLGAGRLPDAPGLLMVDGDRALMLQFLQRYTSRTNWLGAQFQRVQAARASTGKRRRRGGF